MGRDRRAMKHGGGFVVEHFLINSPDHVYRPRHLRNHWLSVAMCLRMDTCIENPHSESPIPEAVSQVDRVRQHIHVSHHCHECSGTVIFVDGGGFCGVCNLWTCKIHQCPYGVPGYRYKTVCFCCKQARFKEYTTCWQGISAGDVGVKPRARRKHSRTRAVQ